MHEGDLVRCAVQHQFNGTGRDVRPGTLGEVMLIQEDGHVLVCWQLSDGQRMVPRVARTTPDTLEVIL